jgi:hypothetical protein
MKSTEKGYKQTPRQDRSIHVCLLGISQVINLRARREATAANFSATLSSVDACLPRLVCSAFGFLPFSEANKENYRALLRVSAIRLVRARRLAKYSFGKDAYDASASARNRKDFFAPSIDFLSLRCVSYRPSRTLFSRP